MHLKFSILNGLPYISGNALPSEGNSEEAINSAFPDFVDKFILKSVYDPVYAPFGGHIIEFKNSADEMWFRLIHE